MIPKIISINILSVFSSSSTNSGQRYASVLLGELLGKSVRRWQEARFPTKGDSKSGCNYIIQQVVSLVCLLRNASQSDILIINAGQTPVALALAISQAVIGRISGVRSIILTLHGNWFVSWQPHGPKGLLFGLLLRYASRVTALGGEQARALQKWGIPREVVKVIPNTAGMKAIPRRLLISKHQNPDKIIILFLSNLIDTKGYREYLEALRILGKAYSGKIRAFLCGKITITSYSENFRTRTEAEKDLMRLIRATENAGIDLTVVNGASGSEKDRLFRNAHIFVLPSRIEAQPISIIEAMASGAVVIASNIGEIPDQVADSGLILIDTKPQTISNAIESLMVNPGGCLNLAEKALTGYEKRFSPIVIAEAWRSLLYEEAVKHDMPNTYHRRKI